MGARREVNQRAVRKPERNAVSLRRRPVGQDVGGDPEESRITTQRPTPEPCDVSSPILFGPLWAVNLAPLESPGWQHTGMNRKLKVSYTKRFAPYPPSDRRSRDWRRNTASTGDRCAKRSPVRFRLSERNTNGYSRNVVR